jgi:TPR repeat protein
MKIFTFTVLMFVTLIAGDYENGLQAIKNNDYKTALKYWLPHAQQGNSSYQFNIGLLYDNLKDYDNAIKWYTKAALQKHTGACNNLGLIYLYIKKDYIFAFNLFTIAANNGNQDSQVSLGYMYDNGLGINMNKIEAYKWWMIAAKEGNSLAQKNLDILCNNSPWACK